MATPTRHSSKSEINQANLTMRQQPWYQTWFRSKGLDPNRVHLSDAQRKELGQIAAQNGMPLGPDGMNIDPAGNINTPHGFASQPTWLKLAEVAAPVAAGAMFGVPLTGFNGLLGGAPTNATALGDVAATSLADVPEAMLPGAVTAASAPAAAATTGAAAAKVAPQVAKAASSWGDSKAGTLLAMGGGAASAIGSNIAANRRQGAQQQFKAEQNDKNRALDAARLNPFRDQLAQSSAIATLDRRQNRMPLVPPPAVQPYMPGGGYTPSAAARQGQGALQQDVMAGHATPSPLGPGAAPPSGVRDLTAPAFSYDPLLTDPSAATTDPNAELIRRRIRQRASLVPRTA